MRIARYTDRVTTPLLRTAQPDEFEAVHRVLSRAFGEAYEPDDGVNAALFEPDRSLVFADGDQIVAHAGAFSRMLTVPGGFVPAAHVTAVGVHPTHRRRGFLTRMMHKQLRDVREGGVEPIALLWASEGTIYQRFGYGHAALRLVMTADRRELSLLPRFPVAGGRLREASLEDARKDLMALYEQVRPERIGWSDRTEAWWNYVLRDKPEHRDGATARHALLYEGAGGIEGYALWRSKEGWDHGPQGEVSVREVVAVTPEAYTELWRFLFSVDLTRTVVYWSAAIDEPLLHMVTEPRRLGAVVADSLWVRIADLPAALIARRYSTPLNVVLQVDDRLLPENAGRWRLTADGDSVTCVPTDDDADLACDVADLGAAYLGGTALTSLAAAGRVRELVPGKLVAASTAFLAARAPSATEIF
jgi:predicted acetyltransferase